MSAMYRRMVINPGDGYFRDYNPAPPAKQRYQLHLILFVITLLTTTCCGAIMTGANPFTSIDGFAAGLPFSLTLLLILGVHEFGHYFAARAWKVNVTLPYFIPVPIPPVGTFGAVIKMRSSIPSRKALVDIGAAGPVSGFAISIIATVVGLKLSTIVPIEPMDDSISYLLGESLMFKFLSWLTLGPLPANQDIMLHPVGFAGWLGFFVTALNLIPFGQLDGGHILFAVSPRVHDLLGRIRFPLLLLLGLTLWNGWFVWAIILLVIGSKHPYPSIIEPRLGPKRVALAAFALFMFVTCIMPIPVMVG